VSDRLPAWAKWLLGILAALLVLYVFGFVVFSCGTERAEPGVLLLRAWID
jgi:hypothetical protein